MTLSLTPPHFLQVLQSITPATKFLVAFSGGLDSHVLLHLIANCPGLTVRALHVHHGLQKEADDWVIHCQSVCKTLNLPLQIDYLNLQKKKGESLEELARKARYQSLKLSLQPDEVLLTAHHQNDQAETLLLQLFRGAGIQGLAAMPSISHFAASQLARPLLGETRKTLERYAQQHRLKAINDPSNQDLSFDRNFVRHQVMPLLRGRWPGIDKTISRTAGIQSETKELLDEIAAKDLDDAGLINRQILPLDFLSQLSGARQKLLIRYWISVNNFSFPSERKLNHLFKNVIGARDDAQPMIHWQGVEIRRFQKQLYIMSPLSVHDNSQVFEWDCLHPLYIPSLDMTLKPDVLHQQPSLPVSVRFRKGGERIYLADRGIHLSLKKYFQEAGVPPWMRSRLPLIYNNNEELIRVLGID